MYKVRHFFVFIVCVIGMFGMPPVQSRQIDRIVAVVNNDVITNSEFQKQLMRVRQELRARKAQTPPERTLNRQVLERMVTDRIQLQVASRVGISVPENTIDEALRELAGRNKLTLSQLKNALARDGISYDDFRENIKSQLIIRRLVDREVLSRVAVTDEEIEGFLANQRDRPDEVKEYNISHILIRVPEAATTKIIAEYREKAQQALDKIRNGMAFEQAAINYSQAQNALEGGGLGWRQAGQLPVLFLGAVRKMQPGQVTDVLRSPNGFHILKLNNTRGGRGGVVRQTRTRHILIKNDEFLSPTEATQRIVRIREQLLAGGDFAELAKANSDDPVSSVNGGDLGWLNPGETVEGFEAVMHRLKIEEISEPVTTPFGVHLIQVLERREQHLDDAAGRNNALIQLRARKSDERYEQWLRRLRDESYVEFKLDEF
jgi:peptidyl-prolyl cis-trans isomerase SurA